MTRSSVFLIGVLTLFACNTKTIVLSEPEIQKQKELIKTLIDDWHKAAADANLDAYFNIMTDDAIYLGTDAGEHWTKNEFYKFCKPYFDKGSAWEFKAKSRHIYFSEDFKTAWFDEVLDTWMGDCRASGVLLYKNKMWKIVHYNLAVAVPNEVIREYIKLLEK